MKFNIINIIAFSLIVILSACSETITELNNDGKISGMLNISDEVGAKTNPVQNFKVQIYDTSGNILFETIADTNGRFSFQNINYGEYLINSKSENYVGYPLAFNTAGGPEEKLISLKSCEIPQNSISIDSIQIHNSSQSWQNKVIMHYHFNMPLTHIGKNATLNIFYARSSDSISISNSNFNILLQFQYNLPILEGQQECELSQFRDYYNDEPIYLQAYIRNPASYIQSSYVKGLNNNYVFGKGSNIVEFYKPYNLGN